MKEKEVAQPGGGTRITLMLNRQGKFSIRVYDANGSYRQDYLCGNEALYDVIEEVFGDRDANLKLVEADHV